MVDFSRGHTLIEPGQEAVVALNKATGKLKVEMTWGSAIVDDIAGGVDLNLFGSNYLKSTADDVSALSKNAAEVVYHGNLGDLNRRPFVRYEGDSGTAGREVMHVAALEKQRVLLVAVKQQDGNGVGSLAKFKTTVIVTDTEGNMVVVPLLQDHPMRYWAAVAVIDCTDPQGYKVRKVEQYGSVGGSQRSPVLNPAGIITMNEGPPYGVKHL